MRAFISIELDSDNSDFLENPIDNIERALEKAKTETSNVLNSYLPNDDLSSMADRGFLDGNGNKIGSVFVHIQHDLIEDYNHD